MSLSRLVQRIRHPHQDPTAKAAIAVLEAFVEAFDDAHAHDFDIERLIRLGGIAFDARVVIAIANQQKHAGRKDGTDGRGREVSTHETKHTPYDTAMVALHEATSGAHAWDIAWLPVAQRRSAERAFNILGAAILAERAKCDELLAALRQCEAALAQSESVLRIFRETSVLKAGAPNTERKCLAAIDAARAAIAKATGTEGGTK